MKKIVTGILILLVTACSLQNENYVNITEAVPIINIEIPDSAKTLELVYINATAQETNGCWSNLHFNLEKKGEFEYYLSAIGNYESYGTCADVIVSKDTTFEFIPSKAGSYLFRVFRSKQFVETDTIFVE
jgi:hypothetical protein